MSPTANSRIRFSHTERRPSTRVPAACPTPNRAQSQTKSVCVRGIFLGIWEVECAAGRLRATYRNTAGSTTHTHTTVYSPQARSVRSPHSDLPLHSHLSGHGSRQRTRQSSASLRLPHRPPPHVRIACPRPCPPTCTGSTARHDRTNHDLLLQRASIAVRTAQRSGLYYHT